MACGLELGVGVFCLFGGVVAGFDEVRTVIGLCLHLFECCLEI